MRLFFYGLSFIFLIACSEKKQEEIPDYVIPKEKIVPILVDMHIADATMINLQLENKDKKYQAEIYYEQIFKKHGITRSKLDSSIKYYSRIPGYYEKIYDDVLTVMSKMSDDIKETDSDSIK